MTASEGELEGLSEGALETVSPWLGELEGLSEGAVDSVGDPVGL